MSKKKKVSHGGKGKGKPNKNLVTGVIKLTKKGFAFVESDGGDYYVSIRDLNGAMHKDTVSLRVLSTQQNRRSGKVVRIESRATASFVGRYTDLGELGVVVARDSRIPYDAFVERTHARDAQTGDWVKVAILDYPTKNRSMAVGVTEIIPVSEDVSTAIELIIAEHDLHLEFSERTLDEARKLESAWELDQSVAASRISLPKTRHDLRDRYILTIDPVDARDFDDAISVEQKGDDILLGVHIADVAAFVDREGAIDYEARRRTTSVYLPDRVLPMLPEQISANICSLRPNEDRYAVTVDILISKDGEPISAEIYKSIIRSKARFAYEEALAVLEETLALSDNRATQAITLFDKVGQQLKSRRNARGGLDFETLEAKVELDDRGKTIAIRLREKTRSTEMIEEAMILANEVVATLLHRIAPLSVYRVHEEPDPAVLEDLNATLMEFGYRLPAQTELNAQTYRRILTAAEGRPEERYVSSLLLRTLKQAYYSVEPSGHFGLASPCYTHFTSPIRRYPDLMVHRILSEELTKKSSLSIEGGELTREIRPRGARPEIDETSRNEMIAQCEACSHGERNAESAERQALKYKVCEYMAEHIGETFAGIISSVTHFGFFVTLDNSAEGLVHLRSASDESWTYNAARHTLSNSSGKQRFRLGQRVEVVLKNVNLEEGLIDLSLPSH